MKLRLVLALMMIAALVVPAFSEGGSSVGGHIKITLFDYAYGTLEKDGKKDYGTQYSGMGLMGIVLYFSGQVGEKASVEFQPLFKALTGATPSINTKIGEQEQAAGGVSLKFLGLEWGKAVIKMALEGIDISAGILKPRFTLEYGGEMFWEDQINGGKFAINDFVGRMQDAGVEISKTLELGDMSVPVYLYLLNGGYEFSDNNKQPGGMIHIEPEWGMFKFTGSFYGSKYSDDEILSVLRWSGGTAFSLAGLSVRSEYAGGKWEKAIAGDRAATPYGFYAKAFYELLPGLRLMYCHEHVYHNFSGFSSFEKGPAEKYITNTGGCQLNLSDTTLEFTLDFADWQLSDGSKKLSFARPTLGWRATF